MASIKGTMNMLDISRHITVVISRRNGWRLKLGAWIVFLGCRVGGYGYEERNLEEPDAEAE